MRILTLCLLLSVLAEISQASSAVTWRKIALTDRYYSDGITAADIDRDGKTDVVAGPFWYQGPDFSQAHAYYPPQPFDPAASPTDSMFNYTHDFNGDGFTDILVLGRVHLHQAFWYENPGTKPGLWLKHFAFHRVQGESPPFLDVDGDRRPELVALWQNQWGLIQPNWNHPTQPWSFHPITPAGDWHHFYHGTGVGDLNGDGRLDVVLRDGCYQQPADPQTPWTHHPAQFGQRGGAQMWVNDVNQDGAADIITALDSHGWGLAWFARQQGSEPWEFKRHLIMGSRAEESRYGVAFSQPHALAMADVDQDGLQDILVGKRRWAHGPEGDVEPNADPVVYWFAHRPDSIPSRFEPHLIDRNSGVGVQITATDVNQDGRPDLLTASKLGAFVFLNLPKTSDL